MEVSRSEGIALFDRAAWRHMKMSGEEFLRRYDAGEYDGVDEPGCIHMQVILPFARPVPIYPTD